MFSSCPLSPHSHPERSRGISGLLGRTQPRQGILHREHDVAYRSCGLGSAHFAL